MLFKQLLFIACIQVMLLFWRGNEASTWVWPQPNKVLAFWPLSSNYVERDIGPNNFRCNAPGAPVQVQSSKAGPFGDNNTAVYCSAYFLDIEKDSRTMLTRSSFTFAFFYYANGRTGGIFEFDGANGLAMLYANGTDLTVVGYAKRIIGQFKIMQRNIWTFVAVTFDYNTGMLTVYGKHGLVYHESFRPDIYEAVTASLCNNQFCAGRAYHTVQYTRFDMAPGDMLSCFVMYNTVLSAVEIEQLQDSCRALHGSSTSGQPRLAYAPIPDNKNTSTMVLKPGQMPWMVSVRNQTGDHQCTASIYSEYFLITSLACAKEAGYGYVIVGDHDITVNEQFDVIHQVKRVIPYPDEEFDLALIELVTPIDLSNLHVNNLPLRTSEDQVASDFFVGGWGVNGRGESSLISNGLPRYSYGKLLLDDYCEDKWDTLTGSSSQEAPYNSTKYLCMAPSTNKRVPCHGDEGSPLLGSVADFQAGEYHLVMFGVYSKRDENCSERMPGFYTNILPAVPWIKSMIACAIPGDSFYPAICPMAPPPFIPSV